MSPHKKKVFLPSFFLLFFLALLSLHYFNICSPSFSYLFPLSSWLVFLLLSYLLSNVLFSKLSSFLSSSSFFLLMLCYFCDLWDVAYIRRWTQESSVTTACWYIIDNISAPGCRICSSDPRSEHIEYFHHPRAPSTHKFHHPFYFLLSFFS